MEVLKKVGKLSFAGCASLNEVNSLAGIREIDESAFSGCHSLKSVSLSNALKEIPANAFGKCISLDTINFLGKLEEWDKVNIKDYNEQIQNAKIQINKNYCIDSGLRGTSNWKIYKDGSLVLFRNSEKDSSDYIIENETPDIRLAIMETEKEWDSYAPFTQKIIIKDGITSIDDFSNFSRLETLYMADSVKEITEGAFYNCTNLKTVKLSNKLKNLGSCTFESCDSLKTIKMPKSLKKIGSYVFSGCNNIKTIQIPSSVTYISPSALAYCYGLEKINVSSKNKNYTSINGVLLNKKKTKLIAYPSGKENTVYTIPKTVTTIGKNAFFDCDNLKKVSVSEHVTLIDEYAFAYSDDLRTLKVPKRIEVVEKSAFLGCKNLKNVDYSGSKSSWKRIDIRNGNSNLLKAAKNAGLC